MCEGGQVWGHARRRGSARLAILFWEKTFRIKNWKQKSAHVFRLLFWTILIFFKKIQSNFALPRGGGIYGSARFTAYFVLGLTLTCRFTFIC